MVGRYLCAFMACFVVSCLNRPHPAPTPPSPQDVVQEVPARAPISADPLLDPSQPPVEFPPAALAERGGDVELAEEPIGRWRRSIFFISGTVDTSVSVTAPTVVLVKAVWRGDEDVTVSVLWDGAVLASAAKRQGPEGQNIAEARIEVPRAGDLVVRTTSLSAQSVTVKLDIGVVERPPKR